MPKAKDKNHAHPELEGLLSEALESTGVVEVLDVASTKKSVKLPLIRCSNESRWKHMVAFLFREEKRTRDSDFTWYLHICQNYLLKEDRLVYTWNFILQSEDIVRATNEVCRMFDLIRTNLQLFEEPEEEKLRQRRKPKRKTNKERKAESIDGELEGYPLVGVGKDRNRPTRHFLDLKGSGKSKGAHFIGE